MKPAPTALLLLLAGCSQPAEEPKPQAPGPASPPAATSSIPPHAARLPKDPILVVALHAGKVMSTIDYEDLVNKPALAYRYSTAGPTFFGGYDSLDDPVVLKRHGLLTRLIESPAQTSGIDPSQPLLLTVHNFPALEMRILAHLGDTTQFEAFIHDIQPAPPEQRHQWQSTGGGHRVHTFNDKTAVAHDGTTAIFNLHSATPPQSIQKQADQWLAPPPESTSGPDTQWLTSQDLAIFLSLKTIVPFLALAMGEDGPPPEFLHDTTLALALNATQGQTDVQLTIDLGQDNALKLGGETLPEELLAILPPDAYMKGGLSLDLDTTLGLLRLLLPFTELSPDTIQEQFGIDFDDLPNLLNGQLAIALTGIREDADTPTFVAALGTSAPAADVYTRIFQKGLLRALRGEFRGNNENPLENFSITAKDHRLLIATRNHADLLEADSADPPLPKADLDTLKPPLLNLSLDFPKLLDSLDLDDTPNPSNEEYILGQMLGLMRDLHVQVRQETPSRYRAKAVLRIADDKTNPNKAIAHLAADLANPYYHHPALRTKIEASRQYAKDNPGAYARQIIGTWSGSSEEEDASASHHKITYHPDKTMLYEDIWIEKEGFARDSYRGHWALHGTTYKEYNEHGGLDLVATILSIRDDTLQYLNDWEPSFRDQAPSISTDQRVSKDYQLPSPPEGLKELEE